MQHTQKSKLINEVGAIFHSWNEKRYRIALVYPNTYHQGMSNLGFLTVYDILNRREDCLCERFFLPDKEELPEYQRSGAPLLSIESAHPLLDFDLIAFSVSFENDYLNLPIIFKLAGIPLYSNERNFSYPLVLLGGVCAFINPEPIADIVNLVAIGEAEVIVPGLIKALLNDVDEPEKRLINLAQLPGIYVPEFYEPVYFESGEVAHYSIQEFAPEQVDRQYLSDLNGSRSRSFIHTTETEFGHMSLIEVSRGCSRGCRFCAAGYVYLPPRERSLDNLVPQVEAGLCQRDRIGLVAAAVADHSEINELQKIILENNAQISMSSLRLDAVTEDQVKTLHEAGHQTVAIAPEAGSQRMRDFINKGISEEQILSAVLLLAEGGIKNLKLYFIIGFPGEQMLDVEAISDLTEKVAQIWRDAGRKRGWLGTVTLSVNPFIPKPFTPFQWAGMEPVKSLKKKLRFLHSAVSRIANTRIINESVRAAVLQTFLSRGDRRVAKLLPELANGANLKQICKKSGLELDFFVQRERGEDEVFPWEIINQGVERSYLWREYRNADQGKKTSPCAPGCTRCGLCSAL